MKAYVRPLFSGILTGLFLQLALGPVFFYILGITIDSSFINSFFGIVAVTLADYIYIVLSLIGIGQLLQRDRVKTIFGWGGSIVLILFGLMMLNSGLVTVADTRHLPAIAWTPLSSFLSCFILTISSPLTIVFWSSVFSAKALEKSYRKQQLIAFGIGTGMATFCFLTITMAILSQLKSGIPDSVVQVLNCAVGVVLIGYSLIRIKKMASKSHQA